MSSSAAQGRLPQSPARGSSDVFRFPGASRVSLSSLSTEALWEKSGRLQNVASEVSLGT